MEDDNETDNRTAEELQAEITTTQERTIDTYVELIGSYEERAKGYQEMIAEYREMLDTLMAVSMEARKHFQDILAVATFLFNTIVDTDEIPDKVKRETFKILEMREKLDGWADENEEEEGDQK